MPVRLLGWSSLSQSGSYGARGNATELAKPGVKRTGRIPLVLTKRLPGVVRMLSTDPLVLGRIQKLKLQTVLLVNTGSIWRIDAVCPPGPVEMMWRLPLPEWLISVLMTE